MREHTQPRQDAGMSPDDGVPREGTNAIQNFAIRDYERTVYVLGACLGAVWGGMSLGIMFGFGQSGPVTWLFLWPAWLDLILLRNPGVLQSCVIGVLGVDSVVWILVTASHLRESVRP